MGFLRIRESQLEPIRLALKRLSIYRTSQRWPSSLQVSITVGQDLGINFGLWSGGRNHPLVWELGGVASQRHSIPRR